MSVTPTRNSPWRGSALPHDPNRTHFDFNSGAPNESGLTWTPDPGGSTPTEREAGRDDATADSTGRYLFGEEIGRGGVGVVLGGWDTQLTREVAIKVLLEEHRGKAEVERRFLEEARIAGRLQHPGIVPIHGLGLTCDGRPYFAMRLVCGRTLEQILGDRENADADLSNLLNVFLQVSQAVAYAHSVGVIHRDLKPANIMVGAFGVVKVMDWGLAKVLGEPDSPGLAADDTVSDLPGTQIGTVFGTPSNLPPEQARGEIDRIDERTDVFGLGSLLCEILTGLPPYTGANGREVYNKAASADTADALVRLGACRAPLDIISLAAWCLSADPDDRPASGEDVVEVLAAHLHSDRRRAEQDLVRFFDLSVDMFCIAGTDGYFHRVNANFPKVLGYSAEELTSRPFAEFVHPEDREKTRAEVVRLSEGETTIQFTNRYRHAEGHFVWFEWNSRTIMEERIIYAVARDVTARMAEAEAHRAAEVVRFHLATIVDSADDAIYSTAIDGIVQSWNLAAERLYGYRAEEIVGKSLLALYAPGGAGEESEILNRAMRGERIDHYESIRCHKDGTEIPVSLCISPVKDRAGAVIGVSRIARDIGDRKKAEATAAEQLRAAVFISEAVAALTQGVGLCRSLQRFAELAVAHLGVAFARVWTLDGAERVLVLRASAGMYTHLDGRHSHIPVGEFKIGQIAQDRKPHLTNAVVGDPRVGDQEWALREGMVAFAGHPLVVGDRVVGVMAVFARHALSDKILETLRSVADCLALGIRGQQLEDENRELRAVSPSSRG